MVQDLMPVSAEAPRCSEFARAIDLLPPGTGLFLSRVILVSVPLPWPKPALKHPLIASAAGFVMGSAVPSRLFACEPMNDGSSADAITVEVFERHGATAHRYRWEVEASPELNQLVESVAAADLGSLADVQVDGASGGLVTEACPPTFLVCTQGSHDLCCGTSGVALADQIERERDDYVVRRVSHTGGHRFSPTLLHFPEGRMWAFVDLNLVDRIANGTATEQDHRRHGRGWWGAKVGPAQVAESAVRCELANSVFVEPHIEALPTSANDFAVTVGEMTWRVEVRVEREVPTVACESPGGLPVKPGREFGWTIERSSASPTATG